MPIAEHIIVERPRGGTQDAPTGGRNGHLASAGLRRRLTPDRLRGASACGVAALSLAACQTVSSTPVDSYALTAESAGLTYFLPMRMVKVTATRKPADLGELVKKRDSKRAELALATTASGAAAEAAKAAKANLAAFNPKGLEPAAAAGAKAKLTETLVLAETHKAATEANIKTLGVEIAGLTADITAPPADGSCVHTISVELLPPQPDPAHRLVARPVHNPMRDDTTALKVNAAGLLSSANVVAADRTSDIIVEIAGAASALGPGAVRALAGGGASEVKVDCRTRPSQFIRVFDPLGIEGVAGKALDQVNSQLSVNDFPYQLRLIGDVDAIRVRAGMSKVDEALAAAADEASAPTAAEARERTARTAGLRAAAQSGALFYRSPTPVVLVLEQVYGDGANTKSQPIDGAVLMLPQAGPLSYVPLQSSAFVKTVNDVQFTDGAISSWNTDRPSEVLEVVRLPVKVLRAVVSVPTDLLKLRVDYSTQDKALAEAQKAQIASDQALKALKLCLDTAAATAASGAACLATSGS